MATLEFTVAGYPPTKNEAKSILAADHSQSERVRVLLASAQSAIASTASQPTWPREWLGLEVVLEAPTRPPSDATNFLGGIADVLESKHRRGELGHLGDLAAVAVYNNDRQIQEVHFRFQPGPTPRYRVRIWELAE